MADTSRGLAPRRRPGTVLVLVGVAGAVLAGVGTWILTRPSPAWTAYAPLSEATYVPGRPVGLGAALLGVGAVLVGGAVGFALARRTRAGR